MDTHTNGLDQMRASRPSQSRNLAKLLKKYKKKAGITLAQLASKAKVPMGTIAGMFAGKLPKHEEPLRALAILLGHGDNMVHALRADRHARGLKPAKTWSPPVSVPTPEEFIQAMQPPMRQAVLLSEVIRQQAEVAEIQKQTDLSKADAEKVLARRVERATPDEKRPGLFTLDDLHALLEQLPEGESLSIKREVLKLEGGAALFTIWSV